MLLVIVFYVHSPGLIQPEDFSPKKKKNQPKDIKFISQISWKLPNNIYYIITLLILFQQSYNCRNLHRLIIKKEKEKELT